jgi:hypothetical protein
MTQHDRDINRRRRLWVVLAVLVAAAAFLVLSATVLAEDPADPCRPPPPARPAELARMPAGLSFGRVGTVTRVRREGRHVIVQAYASKPLEQLTVLIQDAVTAAGYRPGGMDNEGFEAEVFFTTGTYAAGQALVRSSGCSGRWDVDLVLLDRAGT